MDDLNEKAVDIKGKKYVLVSDRVLYFNQVYPGGSITTELLSNPEDARVVVKATVAPGREALVEDTGRNIRSIELQERTFTGHSQAVVGEGMVNKTAALENAETSAVGRALAMMGIGVIESIASADEMAKSGAKPSVKDSTPITERGDEPFPSKFESDVNTGKEAVDSVLGDIKWD